MDYAVDEGKRVMTLLDQTSDPRLRDALADELDGRPIPGVRMTEQQFHDWCTEDVRAEWVNGEVIIMSPASTAHVDLTLWLTSILRPFVEERDLGRILGIESQARLARIPSRRNPDILFVAKSRVHLIKKTYIYVPPDLDKEIVSHDSESRDWRDKYFEYEQAGVREYWIIDQSSQRVEAYALNRAKKYARLKEADERIVSKVLRGFHLRPKWLWRCPLPKVMPTLRE
jgi:Uma2 family endonuclease